MERGDHLLIDATTDEVIAISGNTDFDDLGQSPKRIPSHKYVVAVVLGEEGEV